MLDKLGNHFFPNWEQKNFLKNNSDFFWKMLHSAEKYKGGFINLHSVVCYCCTQTIKNWKGDPCETLKCFRKKSPSVKKVKGDPLVSSGFVGYVKKVNRPKPAQVGAISKAQK